VLGLPYEERVRAVGGREVPERYYVSGVENLSYTVFSTDFVRELSAFREVASFSCNLACSSCFSTDRMFA
jgi:hypothetical protein